MDLIHGSICPEMVALLTPLRSLGYRTRLSGYVLFISLSIMDFMDPIQDNIVFGALFDEVRYKKVLHQCGLERDITLFEAGDQTEVGEKGLTLSGGQKARVTLARAIYSHAQTILLDDVLAALEYVQMTKARYLAKSSIQCSHLKMDH